MGFSPCGVHPRIGLRLQNACKPPLESWGNVQKSHHSPPVKTMDASIGRLIEQRPRAFPSIGKIYAREGGEPARGARFGRAIERTVDLKQVGVREVVRLANDGMPFAATVGAGDVQCADMPFTGAVIEEFREHDRSSISFPDEGIGQKC